MKNSIFISYRRTDLSNREANLLHDNLEITFGKESVFLDVEDLHGGEKWRQVLNEAGTAAKVCIVVIGPDWRGKKEDGTYRINQASDVVRQEIEYAVERNLVILPILLKDTSLPSKSELPASLNPILASQALKLNFDNWNIYKLKLIEDLKRHIKIPEDNSKLKNKNSKLMWIGIGTVAVLASILLWYYISQPPSGTTTPANPSPDTMVQPVEKECVEYAELNKLNGLFFPIVGENNLELFITNKFTDKCDSFGIAAENKISRFHEKAMLTYDDQKAIALKCNADLFFGGQTIGGIFDARFGIINDSIKLLTASPEKHNLQTSTVSIYDLTHGNVLDQFYDKILQVIIGFIAYQKKDYANTIRALKGMNPESLQNDSFRNVVYRVMADACYQSDKKDSALIYLEKTKMTNFNSDLVLKKVVIASETKKYDKAIQGYTELLDSSRLDKNVLLEKRADQYREIKEYKKASEDYKKVQPSSPVQKQRVQTKSKEVDVKIATNRAAFTNIQVQNLSPEAKLQISEKLLENGETSKANKILKTIPTTSIEFKKASPLLLESQVKLNQIEIKTVPKEILDQNVRLRTAVRAKQ